MGKAVERRPVVAYGFQGTSTGAVLAGPIVGQVETASTTQTLSNVGGHKSLSGGSQTFTLPTAVAGTFCSILISSGATNVIVGASTAVLFDSLLAAGATTLVLSTGDAVLMVARSATQWDVLTYSTNVTST